MDYQSLHSKTVVELRQLAKLMHVKLPAGASKAMIIDRLLEAENEDASLTASAPAENQTAQ